MHLPAASADAPPERVHVGRVTAECAYCLTALPIQQQQGCEGVGLFSSRGHDGSADAAEFAVA